MTIAPISATRSWLVRETLRSRRPNSVIGTTIAGMISSRPMVSPGTSQNRYSVPPIAISALRNATETVVPTTCSISAVSLVMRLEISLGLFSS